MEGTGHCPLRPDPGGSPTSTICAEPRAPSLACQVETHWALSLRNVSLSPLGRAQSAES